jgi:hypothetical protein
MFILSPFRLYVHPIKTLFTFNTQLCLKNNAFDLHSSVFLSLQRSCLLWINFNIMIGRAMAQVVSRRPLTTEARVRSQVKSM